MKVITGDLGHSESIPRPIVLDFETEAIQPRPHYPPKPVGFSIGGPGRKTKYYAFGHPTGNNCTWEEAKAVFAEAWNGPAPLLFHNAKFDTDVAETFFNLPPIDWRRVHDTMFLLFLHDPHASSFALKTAAANLLGLPPSERDELNDWLVSQGIIRKGAKDAGAHICKAPGALVGKYADGDVLRTELLFKHLYPLVLGAGMLPAYDRERELMPILLANEREGIRVDSETLRADCATYNKALSTVEADLRKRLKAPDMNLDSGEDLANALAAAGVVTSFDLTKTGQRSVAKTTLTPDKFNDQNIASLLGYRNRLTTSLRTFMEPWLEVSGFTGGRIHTNWNQVRQIGGGATGMAGARTGRISSNPNFQNLPKNWEDKNDGYAHPKGRKYPALPLPRKYILPDDASQLIGHHDYSQQELRILAHFEDGVLYQAYNETPRLDIHAFVGQRIAEVTGRELEKRAVKVLNFGLVYGMGLGKLAEALGISEADARAIKQAHRAAIPGLMDLERATKRRGSEGGFVATWGGRRYYSEAPKMVDGSLRTFEYKLLNYLIQGSAADCTKQALINYNSVKKEGRMLLTVHDEINISVPKGAVKEEMRLLKDAMESVKFDVLMLTEAKLGANWASLEKYNGD